MTNKNRSFKRHKPLKSKNPFGEDIKESVLNVFYIIMAIASLIGGGIWRIIGGCRGANIGLIGDVAESLGSATVLFVFPFVFSFVPAFLLRNTSIGYRRTRLWAAVITWVLLFIGVLGGARY